MVSGKIKRTELGHQSVTRRAKCLLSLLQLSQGLIATGHRTAASGGLPASAVICERCETVLLFSRCVLQQ